MTQNSIDQVKSIINLKQQEIDRHNATINLLHGDMRKILDGCDHRLPNGDSAIRSEVFLSVCTICNNQTI